MVTGFQSEVPPGIHATLDLQVQITNCSCGTITRDLVFWFYRGKGCYGSPLKILTARDISTHCGDNCYIFTWGPVPNCPVCNWYSVRVDYEMCEDCYDFHIADPSSMGTIEVYESLDF